MSPLSIRATTAADQPAITALDQMAFGFSHDDDSAGLDPFADVFLTHLAVAAVDGEQLVGTAGAFDMDVTVPGGESLPCPGVTMIAVSPTHRRQGALRLMMDALTERIREQDAPLAALTASEGSIYGRFGFGRATTSRTVSLATRRTVFHDEVAPIGDVVTLTLAEALAAAPALHETRRARRSGMMRRTSALWERSFADFPGDRDGASGLFAVGHRDASGELDGLIVWRTVERWNPDGPDHEMRIRMLIAPEPSVELALWRFAASVDLVGTITAERPMVEPLTHALVEPRALATKSTSDHNWLRILDPIRAFARREYLTDGRFVVGFADPHLDDLTGHYAVDVDGGHATVSRTTDTADFTTEAAEWASIYAGEADPRHILTAGRARGDAAAAARFFATSQIPWSDVHY